jgi:thiol-disulfide isomerase/thioredoxin
VNAPTKNLNLTDLKGIPAVIVFWGTWCAPCIPEMMNLGKLEKQFGDKIKIIGVSNDNEQKLKYFLQKRPSGIWFATDPSNNLWRIFGIETAGHSVLIDKNNKVVAITETGILDSSVFNSLVNSESLNLKEQRGDKSLKETEDPVSFDSNTIYGFVMQPKIQGINPMMKRPNTGTFAKRRITVINLLPIVILREAFDISIPKKIFYATKEDSIKSNENPLCIDFMVSDSFKSQLKVLFQNELNNHLPVKGKIEKRIIPCYILQPIKGKTILIKQSATSDNIFSFNGLEFEAKGIPITTLISYIENGLNYPVYNATGLTSHYDIHFSKNNIEPLQSIKNSLEAFGLELVKREKEMDVLVIASR